MESPKFDTLIITDDQSLRSIKKSDAIINQDINQKYLTIEESLKNENVSVNSNVEMWKGELMKKLDEEMKQQTTSYIDRFHAVTCKPMDGKLSEIDSQFIGSVDEELNIINTLNKSIHLDTDLIRADSTPKKAKASDQQHVIYLLETKIKQLERDFVQVKSELRNKTSAYEELLNKLNSSEVERRKLITDGRTLKENNKKLENQIYELKQTISNQNSNQERLEKNITNLSKNNKHIDVTNKNKDITINKLSEDKKLLSAEISKLNKMNKEMQTKQDKQNAQYELTLKKLERQKNELFIGFKKQMDYINILKQQKIIQSARAIHEIQKQDYYNMLENPERVILNLKLESTLSSARSSKSRTSAAKGLKTERSPVYKFEDLKV